MDRMTIGIDLAKEWFAVVVLDALGKVVLRKPRLTRAALIKLLSNHAPAKVAMEACGASHDWARRINAMGHEAVLLPAQHVKAYQRGQKNDVNDAEAIAEAARHGRIRPVLIKNEAQQARQGLQTVRKSLGRDKVQLSNQLRNLLGEFGIGIRRGDKYLNERVIELLQAECTTLPPLMKTVLRKQYERWLQAMADLAEIDQLNKQQSQRDPVCRRLETIPGIGPVSSTALTLWMGHGLQFRRGRDAAAAVGVVPRQCSSGGKDRLFGISKRGDAYVRTLLIHGARAVATRARHKQEDPLCRWYLQVEQRRGRNRAVVALANKLVRIAWAVVVSGEPYVPGGRPKSRALAQAMAA